MVTLGEYKDRAKLHNVCDDYYKKWNACRSKRDVMDVALSVQGIEYTAKAIADGWGVSSDYIVKHYSRFINGGYVSHNERGYSSRMYCCYSGDAINVDCTALFIIDSNCDVVIPDGHICEVFVTGRGRVRVRGNGRCVLVVYGDNFKYVIDNEEKVKVKHG